MYPTVPNTDLSWPVTQHSGVISKEVITKLLTACMLFNGNTIESSQINENIIASGILTDNLRSDSNRVEAWRDYQQILSELGLIYSTRATNRKLILTPIAVAFLDGSISYEELITLQLLKYQYPNGHKTQISPRFRNGLPKEMQSYTFAETQAHYGILIRPAVLIFQILVYLLKHDDIPSLSVDELQTYAVRCLRNQDADYCADIIIKSRHSNYSLSPLPRARRNMQDWIKLLSQSPLFFSEDFRSISLSNFSISHIDECLIFIDTLLNVDTFWILPSTQDYKLDWFAFYGNIDLSVDWMKLNHFGENSIENISQDSSEGETADNLDIIMPGQVNLRTYSPSTLTSSPISRRIISEYDYMTSQRGSLLHDSMVDFIARRCQSKGAEVFEDRHSVDLLIRYHESEFLVEVKSITPSNFISRLRLAIGQIKQYDFLIKTEKHRRLALAFTADIPSHSWVIPFVTTHMNMDLLTMKKDDLKVTTSDHKSKMLFSA